MSCSGSRSAATPGTLGAWPFPPPEREVTCAKCNQQTTKFTTIFYATGPVTTCFVCENPTHSMAGGRGESIFSDLTLTHVTDETGQPVRVTSRRQLHEAETRYKFRHVAANDDQANWDKPPQQQSGAIQDNVKWLHPEVAKSMLKDENIQREMARDREMLLGKLV